MRRQLYLGTAMLALALGACGGERQGEVTAEEDRQLNEAAAMLEDNVFDTSADSLVADETVLNGNAVEGNTQ